MDCIKSVALFLLFTVISQGLWSQNFNWKNNYPEHSITRHVTKAILPHKDNIEMAGKRVAAIVSYDTDSIGRLAIERQVFFPQLHPFIKTTDPNWFVYRSYFKKTFTDDILPKLFINNKQFIPGKLKQIDIDGMLHFEHEASTEGITVKREFFPSSSERLFIEKISLTNISKVNINITTANTLLQYEDKGENAHFTLIVTSDIPEEIILNPDQTKHFSVRIMAKKNTESLPNQTTETALNERQSFLNKMSRSLILETPDKHLNTLFEFSKIRASESIFQSKLGLIHSPGGGRYYVGIWANDQAEYVSPFFPYLGYHIGNESALNTYRAFAKKTNKAYNKLPYAFEVEELPPPSLLDRGDAAMIAYGASQYALALGDKAIAQELWPLITWCLEYCNRQLNLEGVVRSESDEMEGRIETGTANLSTSSLYYGALIHSADLARSLKTPKRVYKNYHKQAKQLRKAIEQYFGATVEGLDTYKYYKEHNYLRHWICLPLVVGIHDRKDATIEALFDRLWSENGVHVEKNSNNEAVTKIFWDRGTLYALRGTFLSGATDVSLEKLQQFSYERLLGKRVPYVVEAYPEGNMAHLSAESGLYCRVFIEGLFGITPTGVNSFSLIPRLPKQWNTMALRHIKAFGQDFDIVVTKNPDKLTNVKIIDNMTGKVLLNSNSKLKAAINVSFSN